VGKSRGLSVAVVLLAIGGIAAIVEVRSEIGEWRALSRRLAVDLKVARADLASRNVREACALIAAVKQELAVRADAPKAQQRAEEALEATFDTAVDLVDEEAVPAQAFRRFGALLDAFLVADHAGDGVAREAALDDARDRLRDVRGACAAVSYTVDWDLPKVGPGRAYPATRPATRLVDDVECDWWGSASTNSEPYCVYGNEGSGYSLTGRVETWSGHAPIVNARIAYHVQGLRRPVVTWSDASGDYAFYRIPLRENDRTTCAWRVTSAEGYGTEIVADYIYRDVFGGSIYLEDERTVYYANDPGPGAPCKRWVPPAFRDKWPVSPVADDP
jgi:hypothetical protein